MWTKVLEQQQLLHMPVKINRGRCRYCTVVWLLFMLYNVLGLICRQPGNLSPGCCIACIVAVYLVRPCEYKYSPLQHFPTNVLTYFHLNILKTLSFLHQRLYYNNNNIWKVRKYYNSMPGSNRDTKPKWFGNLIKHFCDEPPGGNLIPQCEWVKLWDQLEAHWSHTVV